MEFFLSVDLMKFSNFWGKNDKFLRSKNWKKNKEKEKPQLLLIGRGFSTKEQTPQSKPNHQIQVMKVKLFQAWRFEFDKPCSQ